MADAIDVAIPGSATGQSKCQGMGFWLMDIILAFPGLVLLLAMIFILAPVWTS